MSFPARTMQAAVCYEMYGLCQILRVEVPVPKAKEVLVKMVACGCCHTDVHAVHGDWPVLPRLPLTPGHEGAGVVEAVGSDVTTVRVGDRVGIPWLYTSCGLCEFCVGGFETLCPAQQCTGYTVDGCFREFAIAQASHVIRLPDNLSFVQAAPILCAGVASYKGLKEADLRPGQFVAIVGAAGGLGHLAIQYAKAMGLRPIALSRRATKAEFCKSLGAELFVDSSSPTAGQEVAAYTQGGAHGVVCVATTVEACELSISLARRKGCVVFCGLPAGTVPTPIFEVALKRLTIRGSIVGTREDQREALDFAARGLVKCTVETRKLEEINDVLAQLQRCDVDGRIVVTFDV